MSPTREAVCWSVNQASAKRISSACLSGALPSAIQRSRHVSLAHSWLQGYDADEQARAGQGFARHPHRRSNLCAACAGS